MALESDTPDTLSDLWARAEAAADKHEAAVAKQSPAAAKPAEPADPKSDTEPAPPPDEADEATPAKPAAKAKPEPKDEPADDSDERKQLDALAKKLGFAVDGNHVAVQERVKFRQEKKEWREKKEAEDAAFNQRVNEVRADLDKQFGRGAKAVEAWERGDFDGVAQALADDPKADWKGLQKRGAEKILSPEVKRIRELEERERQREEAARKADEDAKQSQAQREQQQAVTAYKERLKADMSASADRVVKALSKLPQFVDAMYFVQDEHWDRESVDTIPKPEDALKLPFGGRPLLDTAREMWQSLNEAFGDPDALNQEAPNGVGNRNAEASARPGKKPKTLSRNGAAEVSAPGTYKNDQDFIKTWSKRIAEAD